MCDPIKPRRTRVEHHCYILKDRQPVKCKDEAFWAHWYAHGDNRVVAVDDIAEYRLSTAFLGLNAARKGDVPAWFETVLFRDGEVMPAARVYATWQKAFDGHRRIEELLRKQLKEAQTLADDWINDMLKATR